MYVMNDKYDIAIIGAGPAGIFAAYELVLLNPAVKVVMIEEGQDIYARKCPIAEREVQHCVQCTPCSIMRGFGGAGAYSDGKYNFTTQFGGWLIDYLPEKLLIHLIDYVDEINRQFGAPVEYFTTKNSKIRRKALAHDLHLLDAKVRHLGTENNLRILKNIYDFLKNKVIMLFTTHVEDFKKAAGQFELTLEGNEGKIRCDFLIAAPGRAGAEWFADKGKKLGLSSVNNQVDVGVRVEIPADIFQHITDEVYEAKLVYRTKQYGDLVRTFCMNPKGYVVAENNDGILTVNGHSYRDAKRHSKNTNFALLVSNRLRNLLMNPINTANALLLFPICSVAAYWCSVSVI